MPNSSERPSIEHIPTEIESRCRFGTLLFDETVTTDDGSVLSAQE
jgi:hypothetical protein